MKYIFVIVALLSLVSTTLQTCSINPNVLGTLDSAPKLLQSVKNGQKLIVGDSDNMDNRNWIYIANLKGTHYEMGHALGELFATELKDGLPEILAYMSDQIAELLDTQLPKFLQPAMDKHAQGVLMTLLKLNMKITKKYTNPRYYEEIRGIADGAKVSYMDIAALNMIPELVKAACTVAGVWKQASANMHTLHMRALDWDFKNVINKYPVITVYHPSDPKLQTNANVGWLGMVGSITGISKKISLGEKVWIPPKHSVQTTRYGNPWNYVFRDVLYEATNLETAIDIFTKARRTCSIHIGLGSVEDHSFRMMQYSQNRLDIYDDQNYTYTKAHPKKAGIAYFDKHVQPSGDDCVGSILTRDQFYGKWDMESFWRVVGQSHQTGDTQLVVFDLEQMKGLISYSKYKGNEKAFIRTPIEVNFGELFKPF